MCMWFEMGVNFPTGPKAILRQVCEQLKKQQNKNNNIKMRKETSISASVVFFKIMRKDIKK